jgi:tetratricopeptide (TPR) repeat protein
VAKGKHNPEAIFNAAVTAFSAGDLKKAEREARKLIKILPHEAECWNLRAQIAIKRNDLERAAKYFRSAIKYRPADPAFYNNLGNVLVQLDQHEPAIKAYQESLRWRPESADTAMNLGNVLISAERLEEAEQVFRSILSRNGDDLSAIVNLSYVLTCQRRSKEVVELLEGLSRLKTLPPDVSNNLASNLADMGRLDESAEILARGLEHAPDDAHLRFKNSIIEMLRGNWGAGWRDFDARWVVTELEKRPFRHPIWNNEPLAGKIILVWGEQGIGDEVMFASMIPDLIKQAGKVVIECDPRLAPSFRRSFADGLIVERTTPAAKELSSMNIDYQVAAGDLGRWLRPNEASFKAQGPFLKADQSRVQTLRSQYLAHPDDLLVGITWHSANQSIGDLKSLPLVGLADVFAVDGCTFVNLQYGDTVDDLALLEQELSIKLVTDPDIDPVVDFDAHITQIAAMDLIISVSNSTVHAAGALGIPTWTLLRHVPDRRWLLDREDTPWYQSVRLFRQETPMSWAEPVRRIAGQLKELVARR